MRVIRRFWPLLVIAFVVGSLFRLYTDTGIGFYRMFGTLGIVFLGAIASRIVVTAQLEEGERQVARAMASLPDDFDVWRISRKGADRLVVGPQAAVVVLASSIAHYARGRGLMRSIERLTGRVERATDVARRHLEREGKASEESPIHRVVVLLRRQARTEERRWFAARAIALVSPDELAEHVEWLGRGGSPALEPNGANDLEPADTDPALAGVGEQARDEEQERHDDLARVDEEAEKVAGERVL